MRYFSLFAFALAPIVANADSFTSSSRITAAELYTQGALIQREVTVEVPAGTHEVVVDDLPLSIPLETVRIAVEGAELGTVTMRREAVPPRDGAEDPAIIAADAQIEEAEAALQKLQDARQAAMVPAKAAQARIDFLNRLGTGPLGDLPLSDMSTLVGNIGSETEAALRTIAEAQTAARAFDTPLEDARKALEDAQKARDALVPEAKERALATLELTTETAGEAKVTISYFTPEAGWAPVYNFHLNRETSGLQIERGAFLGQYTGENWDNVAISLTTRQPTLQVAPSVLYPERRRIEDEQDQALYRSKSAGFDAQVVEAPAVMVEEAAHMDTTILDGISVTYNYAPPVTLASGADLMRIELDALDTKAEIYARAVPSRDETAFLMADSDNTSGEIILPSAESRFFLDGVLVGIAATETYAAGEDMTFAFGPIEGLRLKQLREDKQEGDRGLISRTNQLDYEVTYEAENLTSESWPLRVLAQVPYTEQEDLRLTWDASPKPDITDPDGKKGLMEWHSTIGAGQIERFGISYRLSWPEGKALR